MSRTVIHPEPAGATRTAEYTAGYIRLTREESLKKGLSAPAQRSDIADYVGRAGLPEVAYYEETRPVGGDVPWERRAEGRRLIADIRAGLVKHVVVRDMDRLIRDTGLWIQLSGLCADYGVTIHTLSGPLLCSSPTDKFATTVRAAACQLEKDQVGDRVRRVKRQIARQGRHTGGPPLVAKPSIDRESSPCFGGSRRCRNGYKWSNERRFGRGTVAHGPPDHQVARGALEGG